MERPVAVFSRHFGHFHPTLTECKIHVYKVPTNLGNDAEKTANILTKNRNYYIKVDGQNTFINELYYEKGWRPNSGK